MMPALLACLLAACANGLPPPALSHSPRRLTGSPASRVQATVGLLQTAYAHSDWTNLHRIISDSKVRANTLDMFRRWKSEHVTNLRVTSTYSRQSAPAESVETVQFAADPRTVPEFAMYVFDTDRSPAVIGASLRGLGGTWRVSRTPHFVVFHSPYQLVGADRRFLANLEIQRTTFARKFGVRLPATPTIHMYPTRAVMRQLTHNNCGNQPGETGCTRPFLHPPSVDMLIRAVYHEPIHVYELALTPPPASRLVYYAPLLLSEGTAVALEDKEVDPRLSDYCSDLAYAPLDDCARIAMRQVDPMRILSDSGFHAVDAGYAYSLSGSFVKYLILRHGYKMFGKFYYTLAAQPKDRESDYDVASKSVYHAAIRNLVGDWRRDLCPHGC